MRVDFHAISFKHSCGQEATILEISARCDGTLAVSGVCVMCGAEIEMAYTWSTVMSSCTIQDYLRYQEFELDDALADFVPQGRPS